MKAKMPARCSFCTRPQSPKIQMIEGNNHHICWRCIKDSYELIKAKNVDKHEPSPTPKMIHEYLDQYVIGQEEAKKTLSVAVFSHYKKLQSTIDIDKSNILLIGNTGSGKTLLAKTLAKRLRVPIAIGDATALTEAGYVGEDVESLLVRLYHNANKNIAETEKGIIVIDEIDKIRKTNGNVSITKDVSGEGVQQALLKMIEGSICNILPNGGRKHPEQETIPINTQNILFIVAGSFGGLIDIIAKRIGKGKMGFNQPKEETDNELLKKVTEEDLIEFGLIPELVGRLPVVVTLDEISETQMFRIITEPKNSIVKQYQHLVKSTNGSNLTFTDSGLQRIVTKTIEKGTGARGIRSVFETFMMPIIYELPDLPPSDYVIDEDVVDQKRSIFQITAAA